MTERIKRAADLLHDLEVIEKRTSEIEAEWDSSPEDAKLEGLFDEYYREEFETLTQLADAIEEITAGKIDEKTARAMIATRRDELRNLFNKIA